jgi:hypothetical protein
MKFRRKKSVGKRDQVYPVVSFNLVIITPGGPDSPETPVMRAAVKQWLDSHNTLPQHGTELSSELGTLTVRYNGTGQYQVWKKQSS